METLKRGVFVSSTGMCNQGGAGTGLTSASHTPSTSVGCALLRAWCARQACGTLRNIVTKQNNHFWEPQLLQQGGDAQATLGDITQWALQWKDATQSVFRASQVA